MRRNAVIIAVTVLAVTTMVCLTVLVLAGRVDGKEFALLVGSFLSPVVMILLSQQLGGVEEKVTTVAQTTGEVREMVNGHLTSLVAKIPDQKSTGGQTDG